MLLHCVFLKLRPDTDPTELRGVFSGLSALIDEVPGMLGFESGPNRDFEAKTPDFPAGFLVRFETREAHLEYERHPQHVALGARLVAMCEGGAEGITVFDLEVG